MKPTTLGFQIFKIPSDSMQPTLNIGEFIIADTRRFLLSEIDTNDVIAFKRKSSDNIFYIKRVVAIEGQILKIETGNLIVDKKVIKLLIRPEVSNRIVKTGELVGDNHQHSHDSSHWGTVKKKNVVAVYKQKLSERD